MPAFLVKKNNPQEMNEKTLKHCIFQDGNGELTKEEFLRGAKNDKSICQALAFSNGAV